MGLAYTEHYIPFRRLIVKQKKINVKMLNYRYDILQV